VITKTQRWFAGVVLALLMLGPAISSPAQDQADKTPQAPAPIPFDETGALQHNTSPTVFSLEYSVAYSQYNQSSQSANSVAQLKNGVIVAAGLDNNQKNACKSYGSAWLVAVTNSGSPAFQRLDAICPYGGQAAGLVRATSDGGAVVVFGDSSNPNCLICAGIAKVTSTGSVSWQYELTTFFLSAVRGIRQLSTGEFIAVGQAADASGIYGGFIMKLSPAGALESFSPIFYETASSFPNAVAGTLTFESVVPASDGGYLVSGTADAYVSGTGYFWVPLAVKFDKDFNIEPPWPEVLYSSTWGSDAPGSSQYPVFHSRDGNFVLAGTVENPVLPFARLFSLVKLSPSGKILWQYGYGGNHGYFDVNIATSAIQNRDGTFVLAGTSDAFSPSMYEVWYAWMIKVSSTGSSILWQNYYTGAADSVVETQFNDLVATGDGGYAPAGYSYYGDSAYGGPAMLIDKTDGSGNIGSCTCVQPTNESPQALDLVVYPATFTSAISPATLTPGSLVSRPTKVTPIKVY
jgi:hypothetical protein